VVREFKKEIQKSKLEIRNKFKKQKKENTKRWKLWRFRFGSLLFWSFEFVSYFVF